MHCDDRYEVSNLGRVRSWWQSSRGGLIPRRQPKILRPRMNPSGHGRVQIGNRDNWTISRLVLHAFVGPPPPSRPWALHRDDNPSNDTLPNLRWGSPKENKADSIRNGTATGGRNGPRRKQAA